MDDPYMHNLTRNKKIDKLLSRETNLVISYILPDSTEIVAKKKCASSGQFILHKKLLKKQKLDLEFLLNKESLSKNDGIFIFYTIMD